LICNPQIYLTANDVNSNWFHGETDVEKCKLLRERLEQVVDLLDKRLASQDFMAGDVSDRLKKHVGESKLIQTEIDCSGSFLCPLHASLG
jgi:hypothetical protein